MNSYVILMFVAVLSGAQALKCFDCMDCEEKVGNPQSCSEDQDVCMKVMLGDHIVRRCASEDLCGLGKVERATNRAWATIVSAFKDVDKEAENIYCCDDDFCNAGIKNLPSYSIILLPMVLVALLKY